jgi:chorismate synthase
MASNSIGNILRLNTYGESHGVHIGGIVDGFPAGVHLPLEALQAQMARRRPGQSALTTPRDETDAVEFASGLLNGITTGAPIAFSIANKQVRSSDYDHLRDVFRPGHADEVYSAKYGLRDHRGGGRSSARETASWVVAGTLAHALIPEVQITAFVSAVGQIESSTIPLALTREAVDASTVRCPFPAEAQAMEAAIAAAAAEGDSLGGVITFVAHGVPMGWGEPVFQKLQAVLGHALLSINAVKGVEFGWGFQAARAKGSEVNVLTQAGVAGPEGGISGGISNGSVLWGRVAFKPVASIQHERKARTTTGEVVDLQVTGRHDPCVVPRAVPIVESMVAWVLADMKLLQATRA